MDEPFVKTIYLTTENNKNLSFVYFSPSRENSQDKLKLYIENNKDLTKIFWVDNFQFGVFH